MQDMNSMLAELSCMPYDKAIDLHKSQLPGSSIDAVVSSQGLVKPCGTWGPAVIL